MEFNRLIDNKSCLKTNLKVCFRVFCNGTTKVICFVVIIFLILWICGIMQCYFFGPYFEGPEPIKNAIFFGLLMIMYYVSIIFLLVAIGILIGFSFLRFVKFWKKEKLKLLNEANV